MTRSKQSGGLLVYRRRGGHLEVFLVHPGGPFWATKDEGAWSIPKGEFGGDEDPLDAAKREFQEETGFEPPSSGLDPLGSVRQPSGKIVHAWMAEGDVDAERIHSNTFELEWPRGSGRRLTYAEVDRAGWFGLEEARRKILAAQRELIDRLEQRLTPTPRSRPPTP
jgi:predicted NUDIX family NTP pyrophosphohydrolase